MPELPEAQTIARRLNATATGQTILAVELLRRDMLRSGSAEDLQQLVGTSLTKVDTRGKYVVLHARTVRLVVQLGMAGQVRVVAAGQARQKHTHLVLRLADGRELRYSNARRIASGLHWLDSAHGDSGPLAVLGPEATAISPAQLAAALRGRRRAIKAALLDQSLLAGLGNIYTDEALARAGVRPTRLAGELSVPEVRRLHKAIQAVLAEALAAGGSSLNDANPFVDADGQLGYFAAAHRVYGRHGCPCRACGTTLARATVGGRTSSFCPRCQS